MKKLGDKIEMFWDKNNLIWYKMKMVMVQLY